VAVAGESHSKRNRTTFRPNRLQDNLLEWGVGRPRITVVSGYGTEQLTTSIFDREINAVDKPVLDLGKLDRDRGSTELEGRRWQLGRALVVEWFGARVWAFCREIIQDNEVFSQV